MKLVNDSMHRKGYQAYTAETYTVEKKDSRADVFWAADKFPDDAMPNLDGKRRVVLVGAQGTGKSTLFNKLTGSSAKTSNGKDTCTRKNQHAQCLEPFHNVECVDTPGTAIDNVHYNDSYELREALIRKPVAQIVLVCALPSVNKTSEVLAVLTPLDKILKASTFTLDVNGVRAPPKSPDRTRVLLVMTHRDKFTLPRDKWPSYVADIRLNFDWVGSVVFVNLKEGHSDMVPVENLLGSIILPAVCSSPRDYHIPMIEFCSRFPISRHLNAAEEMQLQGKLVEFQNGMSLSLAKLNEIKRERESAGLSWSSGYVDKIGPSVDCVLRFLDDLYERKSLEAVALLEEVDVSDLWTGTDKDINERRVEKWNAVKQEMGEGYEKTKKLLLQHFPTRPIDAIYKKCNHCRAVYVKPIGCDFATTCGSTIGGADSLPFTYDYTEDRGTSKFDINEKREMGMFEKTAYSLRKSFAEMVNRNQNQFYGSEPSGRHVKEHRFEKGCGQPIRWETMIPLSLEELQQHGLVPGVVYAVTSVGKDANLKTKFDRIAHELGLAAGGSMNEQLAKAFQLLGIDMPNTLIEKVDHLYEVLFADKQAIQNKEGLEIIQDSAKRQKRA